MAYSGAQITRLGLAGIPRGLYGSFAGKAASTGAEDVVVATAGGIGKRKRRYAGYPRRILLDGQIIVVQSPEEERALLRAMAERASEQAQTEAAAGNVEAAKRRMRIVKRAETRMRTVDSREADYIRRLHDEDEELVSLIAGANWLN